MTRKMSRDRISSSAELLGRSSALQARDILSVSPGRDSEGESEGFVSETERKPGRRKRSTVPFEQRKRVKKACNTCRHNKLKCDGQNPCTRCRNAKKECRYLEQSSSRADSPRGSSTAEEKLSLLEDLFHELHPGTPIDLHSLREHAAKVPSNAESFNIESEASAWNSIQRGTKNSGTDTSVSDSIVLDSTSKPSTSITVHNQGKTHMEGGSSHWAFFDSVYEAVVGTESTSPNDKETGYQHYISDVSAFPTGNNHRAGVLPALPPRDVIDFLVSTFFQYAQANLFYIHPEIFYRKLNAFYAGTQEFDSQRHNDSRKAAEFICLLFMVLAIGSQFADLEPDSNQQKPVDILFDPLELDISNIEVPPRSPNPGWRFYEVARKLLSDVVSSSSMTSVQACVLQGTFLLSTNARDVSYNVLGLALRMAVNMGMHRSINTESLHPHVRELRNRLWWSVYIAERLFSVEMGRPLAIDDSEIDAPFPVDIPELRVNGRSTVENQVAMAKLCQITGKIVKAVYSSQTMSKNGQEIHAESFKQLRQELDQWKATLPNNLKISSTSSRAVAHLHLTYEQAIILLTRTCLNHAVADNHVSPLSVSSLKFVHRNARDCLSAARSCIQIMSVLRERSLLSRFSFHDFLYCSAALYVLLLGAKLERPVTSARSTILQGIAVLYELAKGSEGAASSLQLISRGFQSFVKAQSFVSKRITEPVDEHERKQARRAWKNWNSQIPSTVARDKPLMTAASYNLGEELLEPVTTGHIGTHAPRKAKLHGRQVEKERISNTSPRHDDTVVFGNLNDKRNDSIPSAIFSDISDVQTFWLPDLQSDFNLLGRDLVGAPSLESFNYYDFASFAFEEDTGGVYNEI